VIKTSSNANGLGFVRYASHKAQGAVNKAKDGPGKRLGAKKSGGMDVLVFGQRREGPNADSQLNRTVCHPRQYYLPPTWYALVSR
jgi:hypothetical protein